MFSICCALLSYRSWIKYHLSTITRGTDPLNNQGLPTSWWFRSKPPAIRKVLNQLRKAGKKGQISTESSITHTQENSDKLWNQVLSLNPVPGQRQLVDVWRSQPGLPGLSEPVGALRALAALPKDICDRFQPQGTTSETKQTFQVVL